MRATDFVRRCDGCGDAAAYALGALEPAEARAFAAHLSDCAICRDELATFEQVTHMLALAAPRYPPSRELRRRVLAGVRAQSSAPARRRRRLRLPGPALALSVAAAFACTLTAGTLAVTTGGPSVRTLTAAVVGVPGDAQLRLAGPHGELVFHGLPQPAKGRIYEVWLQRAHGAPQPTNALFGVTASGDGAVDVPGDLSGVRRLLVTSEPAGGSVVPTSNPVIVATL
jgi:hypothetical protein